MKIIWIFSSGDALPEEKWGHTHGIYLTENLIKNGYKVIYWVSSFSHVLKIQRDYKIVEDNQTENLKIKIIKCRSYTGHISLNRLLSAWDYAIGIFNNIKSECKPDCIILGVPHLFLDLLTVIIAKKYKASLLLDFRDLWPELFKLALPRGLRFASGVIFYPFYLMRKITFLSADGLTAVCNTYRDVAFKQAPKLRNKPNDIIYSTGVDINKMRESFEELNQSKFQNQKNPEEYWVIYAGTLGDNYDIKTLIRAAEILKYKNEKIKILVAGDGPLKKYVTDAIADRKLSNIEYLGALDRNTLYKYYFMSDLGLSLYARYSTVVIPAKAFDYFSTKLPIINSLPGEFSELLIEKGVGFNYDAENPDSLASVIAHALSDNVRLKIMKDKLSTLSNIYDRQEQYTKYGKIVNSIITSKK